MEGEASNTNDIVIRMIGIKNRETSFVDMTKHDTGYCCRSGCDDQEN